MDLLDPETQRRVYEGSEFSQRKASEKQEGGKGLEEPAESPEKEKPASKLAKAVKIKPAQTEETEEQKKGKSVVVSKSTMTTEEYLAQTERKEVKKSSKKEKNNIK